MKQYQQDNLRDLQDRERERTLELKERLALRFHYLRSTQSIPGVYNKKVLSGALSELNPTIDGKNVDDFLKSTFKVEFIERKYLQTRKVKSLLRTVKLTGKYRLSREDKAEQAQEDVPVIRKKKNFLLRKLDKNSIRMRD